jgi:hypothetical protein
MNPSQMEELVNKFIIKEGRNYKSFMYWQTFERDFIPFAVQVVDTKRFVFDLFLN